MLLSTCPCSSSCGRAARNAVIIGGILLLLATGAAVALVLHPVTGPELRAYLRDRYFRPFARLPERTW